VLTLALRVICPHPITDGEGGRRALSVEAAAARIPHDNSYAKVRVCCQR
jgi:hypothetical protein